MTAIRELIEAVEAGEFPHGVNGAARAVFPYSEREADDLGLTAAAAFDGSLDAALALMAAVLPAWPWSIDARDGLPYRAWTDERAGLRRPGFAATADTPARALLLATLKAMEAQP